jgi:hypothetical protein
MTPTDLAQLTLGRHGHARAFAQQRLSRVPRPRGCFARRPMTPRWPSARSRCEDCSSWAALAGDDVSRRPANDLRPPGRLCFSPRKESPSSCRRTLDLRRLRRLRQQAQRLLSVASGDACKQLASGKPPLQSPGLARPHDAVRTIANPSLGGVRRTPQRRPSGRPDRTGRWGTRCDPPSNGVSASSKCRPLTAESERLGHPADPGRRDVVRCPNCAEARASCSFYGRPPPRSPGALPRSGHASSWSEKRYRHGRPAVSA